MNDTVRSYGFIGVLRTPVTRNHENISEYLWAKNTGIDITADGELVFLDYNRNADHETRSNLFFTAFGGEIDRGDPTNLMTVAGAHGLIVIPSTVRSFNCVWALSKHNPISLMKKADFLVRTKQKIAA